MMNPEAKQRPGTRFWLLPLLLVALTGVLGLSGALDERADGYYQQALTRALVTFGLARALNGVISVVQGTEVAVHPAGLGVTFAPGELVDPLNDLVERFSWIMLVASTSLGVQKILMDISAWWGLRLVLLATGLLWIGVRFLRAERPWRAMALRLFLLSVFLRFAMPAMVVLNDHVYQLFMDDDYRNANAVIESTSRDLEDLQAEAEQLREEDPEAGFMDALGSWLDDQAASMNVRARLQAFQDRLADATEHLLRLAAVFLLQTVLLPLAFLWLFARALGNLVRLVPRGGPQGQ